MAGWDDEKARGHFTKWLEVRGLVYVDGLEDTALQAVRDHLRTPGAEAQFVGLVEATGSTVKNKLGDVVFRLLAIIPRPFPTSTATLYLVLYSRRNASTQVSHTRSFRGNLYMRKICGEGQQLPEPPSRIYKICCEFVVKYSPLK